jgi:acid phosphatase class B
MVWKDCGYVSLTKNGKNLKVVVKHTTYFVKIDEAKKVLEGKKPFTLVFEPPQKEVSK